MGIYPLPCLPGFLGFGNGGRRDGGNENDREEEARARSGEKMETFKHTTQCGTSLSFKVWRAGVCYPLQPSTIYVVSAGSLISATQFPCLQNGI